MKPQISILLPNLRTPNNNGALKICLETLVDNTTVDYELIIESVEARRDIYPVCNSMAERARADWIVFHNSDVFMAPGWAEAFLEAADPLAIVTGVIVECGAVGVASANICKDFGKLPGNFRRYDFEEWVADVQPLPPGDGWYFPSLHNRQAFLDIGGFNPEWGSFPTTPCDIIYWNQWRDAGNEIRHVRSYSYHLQHYCAIAHNPNRS
jgi:hypothetical protein